MLTSFPENTWIHVNSEEEGQKVVDYYAEFGYKRTEAHSEHPFMSYPYLCKWDDRGITGHSCVQRLQNTIEFKDWLYEVESGEFEPAEQSSLDALFGR